MEIIMQRNYLIILGLILILGHGVSCAVAQTAIPDTAVERKARAVFLEQSLAREDHPEKLRELAMISAVIAGVDDPTAKATARAETILARATQANPGDSELTAAHGSVLTMMAQFQDQTSQQLRYVKKGFRMMDRALKKDPDNIGALLQRANNSLHMPLFLKRTHYAKRDFERLLDLAGNKGPGFRAMILYQLGQAHQLLKDPASANKYWLEAASLKAGYWSQQAAANM